MEDYKCLVEPEITGVWYNMAKAKLSSVYGMTVNEIEREGVWEAFHNGTTHAIMGEPVESIESYDDTFCMYDHVEEYLDELEQEGDFR